ncbi:hypothetical protein B0H11DRAFT_2278499 [Mycena galericulata]|nr:hypothetical protein B0H11DRAFT_2278499 [Mycena galericulata]
MVLYGPISMIKCNAVHAAPVLAAVRLDLAHFGWLSLSFVHPAHLWSLRPIPLPTSSHQDVYLAGNSSSVCTTPLRPLLAVVPPVLESLTQQHCHAIIWIDA